MLEHPGSTDDGQSAGEEIANTISHGVGLLAAVSAAPFLIAAPVWRDSAAGIVGASVFVATVILLYFTSTLYHALGEGKTKRVFRVLDHAAIYLLIAGTYTPFTLGVLRGGWGWTLFGIVWSLALSGIVLKAVFRFRFPVLSTSVYLMMGWLALIAVKPLWEKVPLWGLVWLLAGGLAYTVGVVFFAAKRVPYNHLVWHLFVLAGTSCHFIAVLYYSTP